jgi:hypothetical protein
MVRHGCTSARQVKGETLTRHELVAECECCGYENPVGGVHISEAGSGPGAHALSFVPSVLIPTQLRLFVIPTRGTIWLPFRQ